jgi:hypothetical protein
MGDRSNLYVSNMSRSLVSLSHLIDKDGLHPDSDDRAIYADVSKYIMS